MTSRRFPFDSPQFQPPGGVHHGVRHDPQARGLAGNVTQRESARTPRADHEAPQHDPFPSKAGVEMSHAIDREQALREAAQAVLDGARVEYREEGGSVWVHTVPERELKALALALSQEPSVQVTDDALIALALSTEERLVGKEADVEYLFERGWLRSVRDFTDEYLTELTPEGRARIKARIVAALSTREGGTE